MLALHHDWFLLLSAMALLGVFHDTVLHVSILLFLAVADSSGGRITFGMYEYSGDWLLWELGSWVLNCSCTWCIKKMSINLDALFFLKCSGIRCVIISFPMFIWGFVSSLIGTNPWLGTPRNPFSTSRICGGASSGAAVCVGSNVVDFAIGKDFSLQCCQVPEFEFSVFLFATLQSFSTSQKVSSVFASQKWSWRRGIIILQRTYPYVRIGNC